MDQKQKRKKRGCGGFLLTVAAIVMIIRIALNDDLDVKQYTVTSSLSEESHRYVLITDLHSTMYGENQEDLSSVIVGYAPEAVFLVGDIGDDKREFDGTAMLLEKLLDHEVYYVTGNHERWVDYTDDIKSLFEEYGVIVLSGCSSVYLGDGIRLFGIDDPLFYEESSGFVSDLEAAGTDGEFFDILLSHRPEYAETYAECGFELTLSGHAHGGQVRIPIFMNGLYAPNQGWFPQYAGGEYNLDGGTLIVSRGLMINEYPRVFNRPEVVVIDVVPQK